MKDQERWKELCEQAAKEQDSMKLIELPDEIIQLNEKEARLIQSYQTTDPEKSQP